MKRSAGILTYKEENGIIKVLLSHAGGPYRQDKDTGAWSISKGLKKDREKVLEAAKREFTEETNLVVTEEIKYLGSKKVSGNKLVIMFYTNNDFDLSNCKSNTFEIEFPKGSGIIKSFPEMDKYEWMDLNKAREYIQTNQLCFLDKLEEILKRG